MALQSYLWQVYCITEGQYVSTVSDTEPTTCPNNPLHTIDPNSTKIININFVNILTDSYINIQSTLSDNQAIKINASDPNGGMDIDAGFGGITVDTTNSISLDAAAASNFTTTNGNLDIQAIAGLVNIDGGTAVNVGNGASTPQIMVGSSANAKNIFVGNNTGSTALTLRSGTGKMIMNSADTASDAITVFSSGGIDVDATGIINLSSANNTLGAVTLDASFAGGGVLLVSGAQGIYLSSNGGPLAFGSFSGGDVYLGTAAIARIINIGNTTGATAVVINSGTGGITIGNDASTGEIQLGNVANDKTVTIGNSATNSRTFIRFGNGGLVKQQKAPTTLADADATLTISDILKSIFTITPTVIRTLTLPTAINAVAGISGVQINDSVDFIIINQSLSISTILVAGTGGSISGNGTVASSMSATFRMRFTNVLGGTEAYEVYRLS